MVVDPIWGPGGPPPLSGRKPRLVHSRAETGETGIALPYITFLNAQPRLEVDDFIEGVLNMGAMSVMYGQSNCGKTFLATDIGLHVAAKSMWRDREVEPGGVIYLALEGGHGIMNRVVAFREEHNLEESNIPFAVVTTSLCLLDPEIDSTPIIETVKAVANEFEVPVKLIIVDTLSRAMAGGNENASEDMTALVATGDAIRKATGAHLLWIHHSGKNEALGARGHSSLRAASDTEIEVTSEGDSRMARITKQRDMECSGEFAFTLKVIELGQNRRGKPVTSCVVAHDTTGDVAGGRRNRPSGQAKRALDVLTNVLAASGKSGFVGAPTGVASVPDNWWRDAFYESAMPGENQDTKQKAFRRAAASLIDLRYVAMVGGRVWLVEHEMRPQ